MVGKDKQEVQINAEMRGGAVSNITKQSTTIIH